MSDSAVPSRARNLFTWVMAQLGQFIGLIGQMVLVGLVVAIVKRRFNWTGFLAAVWCMCWGLVLTGFLVTHRNFGPWHEAVLWGGVLLSMGIGGFVAGTVGRRVAFWESYGATLVTTGIMAVQLARGWSAVLGLGGGDEEDFRDFFAPMPPGAKLLGPMWDRLLGLGAVGGFLAAVLGGSLAYLLYADGARRDTGMEMEWRVALRHLSGRRLGPVSVTAVVAVVGIALGVASLVTVTSVMSGYQQDIQSKILSTNAHLVVQKYGIDFVEYDKILGEALNVEGVVAGAPFTFNEAMLSNGSDGIGVLVKGVDGNSASRVTEVQANLCESLQNNRCVPFADATGKLAAALQPVGSVPSVVIGLALLDRLAKQRQNAASDQGTGEKALDASPMHLIGSRVTLTTPIGVAGARGNAPKRMEFRIGGVFRSGMHEFDARLAYLDLPASQQLLGLGQAVNGVEFRVRDPEAVDAIARKVLSAVGRYPYRTLDWRELNTGIFTALKLQKIVMFLVLCFIVIVASFNIASTLFMAVVEKAREIAVLKSMGARDASIMKIFVLQGWLTGAAGTTLGVLLGLGAAFALGEMQIGIAADVYMVESLQVRVLPTEVVLTVLAALTISHLATLYPALKAARQRPVDAMRYD